MPRQLAEDLKQLGKLAFHRQEDGKDSLTRYHEVRREKGEKAVALLAVLHEWMLAPLSLWPFNLQDLFDSCVERIASGKSLDKAMRFLLEILPPPPADEAQVVVAQREHEVQQGRYEDLVTTTAKFEAVEKAAALDPELKREWNRIKAKWDVKKFQDHKGVIRRTLTSERNMRSGFSVDWKKPAQRFQAVFDVFCLHWNLYGMQHDRPLVLKLSVNVTAHGTMIFIPAYWSFDAKRDIRWSAVMKLHRARSAKRQGPAITEAIEKRREMAEALKSLDQEANRRRLDGHERHAFLCKGLGLVPETDTKRIDRLRAEFSDPKTA